MIPIPVLWLITHSSPRMGPVSPLPPQGQCLGLSSSLQLLPPRGSFLPLGVHFPPWVPPPLPATFDSTCFCTCPQTSHGQCPMVTRSFPRHAESLTLTVTHTTTYLGDMSTQPFSLSWAPVAHASGRALQGEGAPHLGRGGTPGLSRPHPRVLPAPLSQDLLLTGPEALPAASAPKGPPWRLYSTTPALSPGAWTALE